MGRGFGLAPLVGRRFMAKAESLVNVTFGATGEVYEMGEVYDVPAATLKRYPNYFKKKASKPKNKQAQTQENK